MASDLRPEAARLCLKPLEWGGWTTEAGRWMQDFALPEMNDEGFWLHRLLAACRARGWWYMGGAWGWGVSLNDHLCLEEFSTHNGPDGDVSPAGLVAAMLAAEAAEGTVGDA